MQFRSRLHLLDLRASCAMFAATRAEALLQLQDFIPASGKYSRDRNHVFPLQHGNVSRLSPAIRHRLITEQEAAAAPLARYAPSTIEKFTQEVYWRRYWKSWLSLRPQVWTDYLESLEVARGGLSTERRSRLDKALAGDSGLAIMDHFTHELLETGYLHNHARMWWAGWWIHIERLPWQLGAHFFYQNLLDADPASNTLSWRWVAGLQTTGKTYLPRRSNLEKYLPANILAKHSQGLSTLEKPQPFLPLELPPKPEITRPELPVTSFSEGLRTAFFLHEEDLSPETSPACDLPYDQIWVLADRTNWKKMEHSNRKKAWTETALSDALERIPATFPSSQTEPVVRNIEPGRILEDLHSLGIQQVVSLRPEVGPLSLTLTSIAEDWTQVGGSWHWLDRPEDLALRSLATGGFFGFWKKLQAGNHLPKKPCKGED